MTRYEDEDSDVEDEDLNELDTMAASQPLLDGTRGEMTLEEKLSVIKKFGIRTVYYVDGATPKMLMAPISAGHSVHAMRGEDAEGIYGSFDHSRYAEWSFYSGGKEYAVMKNTEPMIRMLIHALRKAYAERDDDDDEDTLFTYHTVDLVDNPILSDRQVVKNMSDEEFTAMLETVSEYGTEVAFYGEGTHPIVLSHLETGNKLEAGFSVHNMSASYVNEFFDSPISDEIPVKTFDYEGDQYGIFRNTRAMITDLEETLLNARTTPGMREVQPPPSDNDDGYDSLDEDMGDEFSSDGEEGGSRFELFRGNGDDDDATTTPSVNDPSEGIVISRATELLPYRRTENWNLSYLESAGSPLKYLQHGHFNTLAVRDLAAVVHDVLHVDNAIIKDSDERANRISLCYLLCAGRVPKAVLKKRYNVNNRGVGNLGGLLMQKDPPAKVITLRPSNVCAGLANANIEISETRSNGEPIETVSYKTLYQAFKRALLDGCGGREYTEQPLFLHGALEEVPSGAGSDIAQILTNVAVAEMSAQSFDESVSYVQAFTNNGKSMDVGIKLSSIATPTELKKILEVENSKLSDSKYVSLSELNGYKEDGTMSNTTLVDTFKLVSNASDPYLRLFSYMRKSVTRSSLYSERSGHEFPILVQNELTSFLRKAEAFALCGLDPTSYGTIFCHRAGEFVTQLFEKWHKGMVNVDDLQKILTSYK